MRVEILFKFFFSSFLKNFVLEMLAPGVQSAVRGLVGEGVGTSWPWAGWVPLPARPRLLRWTFHRCCGQAGGQAAGSGGRIKHKTGVGHECRWGRQGSLGA